MEPLDPEDPEQLGPYRLVAKLGAGGMGQVFLGTDHRGDTVAIKAIRPELAANKNFRIRFRREVDAARAVGGVFTAAVVDADPEGSVPWLATEHILGPTLADAVMNHGPLPAESALALGAGLAEALIAVHSAGLVHRDLKPTNVLLSANGPRVIDFGIVQATDGYELTQSGVLLGSPLYMCPEHATGAPMGPASDVFCLGSVLAFATTGRSPFSGSSAAALLYQVVHGRPDLSGVPDPLDKIIGFCLNKTPDERPTPNWLSATCLPSGADQMNWEGWLPESVTAAIAWHTADLMDLQELISVQGLASDGVRRDPRLPVGPYAAEGAESTAGGRSGGGGIPAATMAIGGGTRGRPAQGCVKERTGPNSVTLPTEPEPEHTAVPQGPPPTRHASRGRRARAADRSVPSRRTVFKAAMSLGAVATVGGGAALLLSSLGEKATGAAVPKPLGPAPTPFWTHRSDPLLPAPAAFNAGTALVKTRAGNLVCLDLKDGTRPKWTYRGISQSPTPAFLVSDALVALGNGSTVIGVDPSTGTERFSLDFGADFQFDTLLGKIKDNSVSILGRRFERAAGQRATSTDVVLGTDLRTRRAQVIPINAEDRGLDVKPVIVRDRLVFIDGLNNVAAATTDRGGFAWRHPIGPGSRPAPVALGPTVFAVGRDLVAVDAASGQLRWRVTGDAGFASIAAAGSTIYCTTTTPYGVQAFNAADGSRSWFCRTPPLDLNGTLAACPHAVFVPALENRDGFYAIDAKRGRLLWNFTDGQDTGVNAWQLSTDTAEHLIAQHFDRTYALPIP